MLEFDQSLTWQALEQRLAETESERPRALLQTLIDHAKAEAAGDVDGLMATLVAEPRYHFWTPAGDVGPKGYAAVRKYYEDYVASGAAVFMSPIDRVIIDDSSIAHEGTMTTLAPWRVAKERGYAIPTENGHYALRMRLVMLWTFDEDALAYGEDSYAVIDPRDFSSLDDDELPHVYVDYLKSIGQ